MREPIAHVSDNGYVTPITKYSKQTLQFIGGRFLYTNKEVEEAISHWDKVTTDLRELADNVGDNASIDLLDHEFSSTGELIQYIDSQERETVPAMDNPTGKRGKTKKSKVVKDSYVSPLPGELHVEQNNVNLTPEEQANMTGIDANKAMQEVLGIR